MDAVSVYTPLPMTYASEILLIVLFWIGDTRSRCAFRLVSTYFQEAGELGRQHIQAYMNRPGWASIPDVMYRIAWWQAWTGSKIVYRPPLGNRAALRRWRNLLQYHWAFRGEDLTGHFIIVKPMLPPNREHCTFVDNEWQGNCELYANGPREQ